MKTMTEKQRQVLTDELEIHLKGKKIILILDKQNTVLITHCNKNN